MGTRLQYHFSIRPCGLHLTPGPGGVPGSGAGQLALPFTHTQPVTIRLNYDGFMSLDLEAAQRHRPQ